MTFVAIALLVLSPALLLMAKRKKKEMMEKRVRKKHAYQKRIYIHSIKQEHLKTHNLRQQASEATKMAAREGGEFNEIETVEEAVTFPISKSMVYVAKALHNKPHGQATNESLAEAKEKCQANGVSLTSCEKMSGTFAHNFVNVAYEDSPDHVPFLPFSPFKEELCKFVQEHGTETPHKRDLLESGFAKRFILGFKQGQGLHSRKTDWVQPGNDSNSRVGLAFFNPEEDKTSQMSPGLKAAIGDVASKLKQFTEKAYPGRTPDPLRERLFGNRFAAIW